MFFSALAVFAVTTLLPRADAATCGSTTNSEGISSDDIGSAHATTVAACCTACLAFTNTTTNAVCEAAVWAAGQQTCYFKGSGYKIQPASAGSWVVTRGTSPTPTPPSPTPPSPTPPSPTPPSPTPPAGTPTPWPTGADTPTPTAQGQDPGGRYAAWSVWPEPHEFTWTSNDSRVTSTLPASFAITCKMASGGGCPAPLTSAAARYQRTILRYGAPSDVAFLTAEELETASYTEIADRTEFDEVNAHFN